MARRRTLTTGRGWRFGDVVEWRGAIDQGARILLVCGEEGKIMGLILQSENTKRVGTIRALRNPDSIWWTFLHG